MAQGDSLETFVTDRQLLVESAASGYRLWCGISPALVLPACCGIFLLLFSVFPARCRCCAAVLCRCDPEKGVDPVAVPCRHHQVSPVRAMTSRNSSAYIPPAVCRSYQNLCAPFFPDIFRRLTSALRFLGHQTTMPETSMTTKSSVLTPTMSLPTKGPPVGAGAVEQPAVQPEHDREKRRPFVSPHSTSPPCRGR